MRQRVAFWWGTAGFVGTASAGLYAMVIGFAVFFLAVTGPWSSWDAGSDRISAAVSAGIVVAGLVPVATSRIFVRGDTVHVVSVMWTYLVPVAEIVDVDDRNGFAIRVVSRRNIFGVCNQSASVAEFTGNRRGRRASRRLTALCGPFQAQLGWNTPDTVGKELRWRPLVAGVPIILAFWLCGAAGEFLNRS